MINYFNRCTESDICFLIFGLFRIRTVSPDIATADGTAMEPGDYTSVDTTLMFDANDAAQTTTVSLASDTALEDLEYLEFSIGVTTHAATAMTASASANANMAKIFIMDRSSKYNSLFR